MASRDAGGVAELFGPAAPAACTIQCDGYEAYPAWAKDKPHILMAGCHAHMRRKIFEAEDQEPKLIAWILRQIAHLYRIESQLGCQGRACLA